MKKPDSIALTGTFNKADTGPSRVLDGFATALGNQGIAIHAFTHGDRDTHPHPNISINQFEHTPDSIPGFLSYFNWVRKQIAELDPSLVHPLEEYPFSADIRTVQWTSDSYERWKLCREDFRGYGYFSGDILLNAINRIGAGRTDVVVASSPETERQMRNYWRMEPDTVIPLGVDADTRTQPTEISSPPQVLLPGRITPKKGQREFLQGLNQATNDYQVDIVGGVSDDEYWGTMEKWHDRHHGFVSRNDLLKLYSKSDIVAVPAIHENFSLVALEAIAMGCILVITRQCGFAQFESAQDSDGVFVLNNGTESAKKVEEIVALGEEEIMELKRSAYYLSNRFTWDKVAAKYLELYQKQI